MSKAICIMVSVSLHSWLDSYNAHAFIKVLWTGNSSSKSWSYYLCSPYTHLGITMLVMERMWEKLYHIFTFFTVGTGRVYRIGLHHGDMFSRVLSCSLAYIYQCETRTGMRACCTIWCPDFAHCDSVDWNKITMFCWVCLCEHFHIFFFASISRSSR